MDSLLLYGGKTTHSHYAYNY